MTEQNIPADDVREIIKKMRYHANHDNVRGSEEEYVRFFASQLEDLLPTPTPPTLADMTRKERDGCRWMQADTKRCLHAVIIAPDVSGGHAALLDQRGNVKYEAHEDVTPRPDLPRLEWPGTEKVEDANTVKVGDVIESATDPRLDALPAGTVLADCDGETVAKRSEEWAGLGYIPIESEGDEFGPWTVRRIGWEADQ